MRNLIIPLLLSLGVILVACPVTGDDDDDDATNEECEECLDTGGTWQPEAGGCTENCAAMDVSCFTDECPGACEDDCSFCFSSADCEAAGCTWHAEDEAMWCTD